MPRLVCAPLHVTAAVLASVCTSRFGDGDTAVMVMANKGSMNPTWPRGRHEDRDDTQGPTVTMASPAEEARRATEAIYTQFLDRPTAKKRILAKLVRSDWTLLRPSTYD